MEKRTLGMFRKMTAQDRGLCFCDSHCDDRDVPVAHKRGPSCGWGEEDPVTDTDHDEDDRIAHDFPEIGYF